MVTINGKVMDVEGKSIAEYLSSTEYNSERIAIERNGEIVSKREYDTTVLCDGDSLEIVSFVGGG